MEDDRIGLFIDYENLAIGAREDLKTTFDFGPIADALAERGRVVVRRAYADWSRFEKDRKMLVDNHIELLEITQRRGMVRKNAADIKMAVDAIELAFEREYITTFVICTGDSDFTPLVHKLRELNKRVIGVGLKASTSALLPPACDEFLFYENLVDLDEPQARVVRRGTTSEPSAATDLDSLDRLVTRTLSGLLRSEGNAVRSSHLKRALMRKDSTFAESDYGFRTFGELIRNLAKRGVVDVDTSVKGGDPGKGKSVPLSGLKDEMRKTDDTFSEGRYGYSGFLQFVKAAKAQGVVNLEFDADSGAYSVTVSNS
jgi:uncharacterized protein (TIGR00288 family)